MAIYHFSVSVVTRSHGQSACAASAYITGAKITNEYDGITHDYRKKMNVKYSEVMLPKGAPESFKDCAVLWNNVELTEKSSTTQLARTIQSSLPVELMENKTPEEYDALYINITKEFLQQTFVDDGMIAHFAYHNPPLMNSKKQPVDIHGNVTNDPDQYVYNNPHVHIMLTMRPITESGKWASKSQKLYVCEKDGVQKSFTAAEFKTQEGWEKIWKYRTSEGKTVWHTKSYALQHPEEGLTLASNSPKCIKVKDPTVARWDSPETLEKWRVAWADTVNMALEEEKLDIRVDHRSYERQGLDCIPMINEPKYIIIEEKRRFEEYQRQIRAGEHAVLVHTDIRSQNILIRRHNEQIRIRENLKRLQEKLEILLKPVQLRIHNALRSVAEKLEHLRAEIIFLRARIKKALDKKGIVRQKVKEYSEYMEELPDIDEGCLRTKLTKLRSQLNHKKGPFAAKHRLELEQKMKAIESQIRLSEENQKIFEEVQYKIQELASTSKKLQSQIRKMQKMSSDKNLEYNQLEASVSSEEYDKVSSERIKLRSDIEKEVFGTHISKMIMQEAEKFDSELEVPEKVVLQGFDPDIGIKM